jgi:hypothetical protein
MTERRPARAFPGRGGFSVIELAISLCFLVVVFGAAFLAMDRETRSLSSLSRAAASETRAKEFLLRIEQMLVHAQGCSPTARLVEDLDESAMSPVYLDTLRGFPDLGTLILERGGEHEERLSYSAVEREETALTGLKRGLQRSRATGHPAGALVLWAGLSEWLAEQDDPPPGSWDGIAAELTGPVHFRGDGTGFSFRLPIDPAGGREYIADGEVRWGAKLAGTPTTDGWSALYFEPVATFEERGMLDANLDGDRDDAFDVGRIRLRSWNAAEEVPPEDVAVSPPLFLQEIGAHGGDLDGDGFDDPLFLWDPGAGSLHVRLTILDQTSGARPILQRTETVIHLRNTQSDRR